MYFIGVQLKMYIISSGIFKEVLPLNSGFIHIVLWKLGFNLFIIFFFPVKKKLFIFKSSLQQLHFLDLSTLQCTEQNGQLPIVCNCYGILFSIYKRGNIPLLIESFNLSLFIKQCVNCMVYSQLWASQLFDSPVKAYPLLQFRSEHFSCVLE